MSKIPEATSYDPGKRSSTEDPLTVHDVAERLDKAALRVWKILSDTRQLGLMGEVKQSRYLSGGVLEGLRDELASWLPSTDTEKRD